MEDLTTSAIDIITEASVSIMEEAENDNRIRDKAMPHIYRLHNALMGLLTDVTEDVTTEQYEYLSREVAEIINIFAAEVRVIKRQDNAE